MWSTTKDAKLSLFQFFIDLDTEPKIDDLGRLCFRVKKDVVQFQVAMGVPPLVHVGDSVDDLAHDDAARVFGHALVREFFDVVVKAGTHALLHHQMHMRPLINHLEQRHDVRVVQITQRVYLAVDCLGRLLVC